MYKRDFKVKILAGRFWLYGNRVNNEFALEVNPLCELHSSQRGGEISILCGGGKNGWFFHHELKFHSLRSISEKYLDAI